MDNVRPSSLVRAAGGRAWPLALPVVAYAAARAPRGEMIPAAASSIVSTLVLPTVKFALGSLFGGPLAGLAATFVPTPGIDRAIYGGFRTLSELDRRVNRLECGGDYRDTETARALRMRAMSEMSGAFAPARRMLGREAELLHA